MKLEWGKKVCCSACSSRFYDLQKASPLCPHCGNAFSNSDSGQKKRSVVADKIDLVDEEITNFDLKADGDVELNYSPEAVDELDELGKVEAEQE